MADEKCILLLSDLHAGSNYGLFPDNFDYEDPRNNNVDRYVLNTTQRKLLAWWNQMLARCAKRKIECIILNGDLIEGSQVKEYGRGTIPDLSIQAEACMKLLEQLPECPTYYTLGSGYHTMAQNLPIEQWIAKQMGGIYGDDLLIDEAGIRIHAQHYIPVSKSTWQYRSTPLARDLLLHAVNAAADKYGHVDVIVRSHAHYFISVYFRSQMGIITPCWQTRNPFAVKHGILTPPDIGYVLLRIEDHNNVMIDRSGVTHIERPSKIVNRGSFNVINHNRRQR